MERERLEALEVDVVFFLEIEHRSPWSGEFSSAADFREPRGHGINIDGFRFLAEETHDHRSISAVALSGGGEGAVKIAAEAGNAAGKPAGLDGADEPAGGPHGAHGVG